MHSPPGDERCYCSAACSMDKHPLPVPLPDHATQRTKLATRLQLLHKSKIPNESWLKCILPLPPSRPTSHCLKGQYLIPALGGATALGAVPAFFFPPTLLSMEMRQLKWQPWGIEAPPLGQRIRRTDSRGMTND